MVAAEPGRSFGGLNRSMGPADWPQATSLLHGTQQKRDRGGWVGGWGGLSTRLGSTFRFSFSVLCTRCLEEANNHAKHFELAQLLRMPTSSNKQAFRAKTTGRGRGRGMAVLN